MTQEPSRLLRWIETSTTAQSATMRHRSALCRLGIAWKPTLDRSLKSALFTIRDSRIVTPRRRKP